MRLRPVNGVAGSRGRRPSRTALAPLCALLLVLGFLAPLPARADSAPTDPTDPRTPTTVTADALPTVQINGVVWDQAVIGNTVYAVGEFSAARPAGVPAGQQETPRANILAYELDTGRLLTSFTAATNAVVKSVAASPDGDKLFIGGGFTSVNGQPFYRVAALDPTTGAPDPAFRPVPSSRVNTVATDGTTVYFGGWFGQVGSQPRGRLAAVDARTGELRNWTPVADAPVDTMVLSPDGSRIVVGGTFLTLNGSSDPGMGMGMLSTSTGEMMPWKVGSVVRNGDTEGGASGGIHSLGTDGDVVYGTGWTWQRVSNFEGTFSASWEDGAINWLEACQGDSYDSVEHRGTVYVANHAHNCESVDEFTDSSPLTHHRAIAFSEQATGVLGDTYDSYFDFSGHPAPSLLNWFPDFSVGTYTGQNQGPWTTESAGEYLLMGGEFQRVNGQGQQGLARLAPRDSAPNLIGPEPSGEALGLTATSRLGGAVGLTWTAAADRDNENLVYRIIRDGNTAEPLAEVPGRHRFYNRALMGYTDLTAEPGRQHNYQVIATDPTGRSAASAVVSAAAATGDSPDGYVRVALEDRATHHWRMGALDSGLVDVVGGASLTADGQLAGPVPGRVAGSEDATAFSRTDTTQPGGYASTTVREPGPQAFTVETWVRTSTTTGGKILGFANSSTRSQTRTDRMLWMSDDGRLHAGVFPDRPERASSTEAYNDGAWHHVTMSLGRDGLKLYVDGEKVGENTGAVRAQYYDGYWHMGGGTMSSSWPDRPTTTDFTGHIDDTTIYGHVLQPERVQQHFAAAGGDEPAPEPPEASFTAEVSDLSVSFDGSGSAPGDEPLVSWNWDFGDGATGTGTETTHEYAEAGTYTVRLTVEDAGGGTATTTQEVTVSDSEPPTGPGEQRTLVDDSFDRTGSGWGTPGGGLVWSVSGSPTISMSTVEGAGVIDWTAAASSATAQLTGTSALHADVRTTLRFEPAPNGGGGYLTVRTRSVGGDFYHATLRARSTGAPELSVRRATGWQETVLAGRTLTGLSTEPGQELSLRFEVIPVEDAAARSTLRAKVWPVGEPEPDEWQVTADDATAALQRPGGFAVGLYVSGSATNAPGSVLVNRFTVGTTDSD